MLRRPAVWAVSIALAPFTGPMNPGPVRHPVLAPYAWIVSGSTPVGPACAPVPEGLVSWWRGDTNALDVEGINPGTLRGNVGYAPGMVGQGFNLNGGYIRVPNHPTLNLMGQLTVEFWFKYTNATISRTLLSKRAVSGRINYAVNLNASFLGLGLLYNDPTALGGDDRLAGIPTQFETIRKYPAPTALTFHHFAGTYLQTAPREIELRMYVDGALIRSAKLPGNLSNALNDSSLTFGNSVPGGVDPYLGVLDEIAVYSRALTAEEVAAIHQAGSAGKCRNHPFASFALDRTRIGRDRGATQDQVEIRGRFALAASSDGIAPLTEEVQITLGSLSWTVPAGAFVRTDENNGFQYHPSLSTLKQVFLWDDGTFRIRASELDLPVVDSANPLTFGLRIGNDEGIMNVVFAERERGRTR